MNHPFVQLLLRWVVMALGVTLATRIIPGIRCDDVETLVVVVLLLSFLNAILRPLLVLLALPFILLTLGLGMVVINALLFYLVSHFVSGFHVSGFWSAVGGALVLGVTNLFLGSAVKPSAPRPRPEPRQANPAEPRPPRPKNDDVIDI